MLLSNRMDDDLRAAIVLKLMETSHEIRNKGQFILTDSKRDMTPLKGH